MFYGVAMLFLVPYVFALHLVQCGMIVGCFVVFFYGGDAGSFWCNLPIGQALSQGTFLILARLRGGDPKKQG